MCLDNSLYVALSHFLKDLLYKYPPSVTAMIVAAYELRDRRDVLAQGHTAKVILADEQNRCQTFFEQRLDPEGIIGANLLVTTPASVGESSILDFQGSPALSKSL